MGRRFQSIVKKEMIQAGRIAFPCTWRMAAQAATGNAYSPWQFDCHWYRLRLAKRSSIFAGVSDGVARQAQYAHGVNCNTGGNPLGFAPGRRHSRTAPERALLNESCRFERTGRHTTNVFQYGCFCALECGDHEIRPVERNIGIRREISRGGRVL